MKKKPLLARAFDHLVSEADRRLTYEAVEVRNVYGRTVPTRPWPTVFYVSRHFIESDHVEVRKLTPIGLLVGMARNVVSDAVHLFVRVAYTVGFLDMPAWEMPAARWWRWDFWSTLREHRDPVVTAAKEARWEAEARAAWEALDFSGVRKVGGDRS